MLYHLAGDDNVEFALELYLFELLEIRSVKFAEALCFEQIYSLLIEIEPCQLGRDLTEVCVKKRSALDGIESVWKIRTTEVKNALIAGDLFQKLNSLDGFESHVQAEMERIALKIAFRSEASTYPENQRIPQ